MHVCYHAASKQASRNLSIVESVLPIVERSGHNETPVKQSEAIALRAKWQTKVAGLREKTRQGVDVAEIGAGAAMAGYLDTAVPSVMGIPTSAAVGIAAFIAGSVTDQRDLSMLGTGLLAGAAYKQGQSLAVSQAQSVASKAASQATG